jgi:hypothetical protein
MDIREQFRAARRFWRTEPSLFREHPQGVAADVLQAAALSCVKSRVNWQGKTEWSTTRKASRYGCRCTSCAHTSLYMQAGFAAWPCDEPKGAKRSATEYTSHVSHLWEGVRRSAIKFEPGQAPIYPSMPGLVHPVAYNTAVIRWNAQFCKKYVPEPEPVRIPTAIDMARQLREQVRAERKATKEWAKQLRAA